MPEIKEVRTEKKSRHRSPAYPAVGLREAIERLRKFYTVDHKAGAPAELAVKHMGFATAHGQAMSVLAALKKFELVTESNGRIVPTQRAIEIIELPANDPRRGQAIKDAALSPAIYRELIEQHRESGWPADDVLEAELKTYKNFNRNAVGAFVKDLKDTLDFAGLSDLSELEFGLEGNGTVQETSQQKTDAVPSKTVFHGAPKLSVPERLAPTPEQQRAQFQGLPKMSGVREDIFSLAEGPVAIQWPATLSKESFEDLSAWLDILKRKIGRSVRDPKTVDVFDLENSYSDPQR